jgi:hypothetical protein
VQLLLVQCTGTCEYAGLSRFLLRGSSAWLQPGSDWCAIFRGPISNLPAAIAICSHLEACAHAVAARLADPQCGLRGFKTSVPQPHSPFAASLTNPLHLWHLSLLWLRTDAVESDPRSHEKASVDSAVPVHRHSMLSNLPSTIEEGSDPSLDAEAAMQTIYKHVRFLIAHEWSSCGGRTRPPALKQETSDPRAEDDNSSAANQPMRQQVCSIVLCTRLIVP